MKGKLLISLAFLVFSVIGVSAQTPVDLGNGFKPWGSYDGGNLDSIDLETGKLLLHAPILPNYPQRGGKLDPQMLLYVSSGNWHKDCSVSSTGAPVACKWSYGGTGVGFARTHTAALQRGILWDGDPITPAGYTDGGSYSLSTWDGASHRLIDISGGSLARFLTMDGTGYQVVMSNPDQYGINQTGTIIDRSGIQQVVSFGGHCSKPNVLPPPAGMSAPNAENTAMYYDSFQISPTVCTEHSIAQLLIDPNGNQISMAPPLVGANPPLDTMGRPYWPLQNPVYNTDPTDCASTSWPFDQKVTVTFQGTNGSSNQIQVCYSTVTPQTAFGVPEITEYQNSGAPPTISQPTAIILADGNKWVFDYNSYGDVSSITLPTGGSISYSWITLYPGISPQCEMVDVWSPMPAARAVQTRTVVDNNGHSYTWTYHWGAVQSDNSVTNWVTDPAGNDTVHFFKTVLSLQCSGGIGAQFHEIRTQYWKGPKDTGTLLKQVDTSYGRAITHSDNTGHNYEANVVPTDITTTVYPANHVSLVHKDYDSAYGASGPMLGNVVSEKVYDWGAGAAGALLRETDTVYKWQKDSAYLTANMIDLPVSTVVITPRASEDTKSSCPVGPSQTAACTAETDYSYDEGTVQGHLGAPPSGSLVSPPNPVRGNLTTLSHWLNTSGGFVSGQNVWFDTGMLSQSTDPLGHTTTYNYDPSETLVTKTCNAKNQCVYGGYESSTGLLTSFTDANGSAAGDPAHTTNYVYDGASSRLLLATLPPDANGLQSQTTFSYSDLSSPNVFPMTVTRSHPVIGALRDSSTTTFDGLGRAWKTEHAMPTGPPATVTTDFDLVHNTVTVTNPFFTTGDPTYGSTATLSDALGRPIQVTEQDGSIKQMSYDVVAPFSSGGDCTLATDELGNLRRTCNDALGRLTEVDEPHSGTVASYAQGTVTIGGNEQLTPLPAASGTGYVDVGGSEGSSTSCTDPEPPAQPQCTTIPDGGVVSIQVGSYPAKSAPYGATSTASSLASDLASAFHNDTSAPVDAVVDPGLPTRVLLTARTNGTATDYALVVSPLQANATDFYATASGSALTGGRDGSSSPDAGTVTVTINGTQYQASYGGSDSPSTIAQSLEGLINAGTVAGATLSGATLTITANNAGPGGNYSLTTSSTYDVAHFAGPSFTPSPASGALSGGYNAGDFDNHPFVTLYSYDVLGNLLCVEQRGDVIGTGCSASPSSDASSPWRVRRFTYDSLGRLLTAHNPESGTITYTYDIDGNLLTKTDARGVVTNYSPAESPIDVLHRVTKKTYSDGTPSVIYGYDTGCCGVDPINGVGRLTYTVSGNTELVYRYDAMGRITSQADCPPSGFQRGFCYWFTAGYDLAGDLVSLQYPDLQTTVTYTPDSAGRIVSVADNGHSTNYVSSATYGPDGQLAGFVSGGAVTNAFSYNKRLQPVNMSAATATQTVFSIGYDFHPGNGTLGSDNGNVWGITNYKDQSRNQTFNYDALNRLISAQNAGTDCTALVLQNKNKFWGDTYGYDPWGNLTNKAKISTACAGELLNAPALVNNQLSGYGYDAAGNMTSDPTDQTNALYDAESRIKSLNSGLATYTYNPLGNRVRKDLNGGASTEYFYFNGQIMAELNPATSAFTNYVYFDGDRVARRDGTTGPVSYYFSDHLKTATVITDSAGNITAESDYYPWGGELQFVNNDSNHYKFTGKERDSESGLDYFGARYYSNGLGRFISADWSSTPIPVPYADFSDPESLNLYSYVRNVPTVRIDPDGHCCSFSEVMDFVAGAANAYGSDMAFGAGRLDGASNASKLGAAVGDAVATVQGTSEFLAGIGGEAGGLLLDATGVGALVGIPANVASAGALVHGGSTAINGIVHLAKNASESGGVEPYNRKEQYGNTSSSQAAKDARAAGEGQPCPNCGETQKAGGAHAPQAEHSPTLKQHWYTKGHKMSSADRKAYARSKRSLDGTRCKTCQASQGGQEKHKQY